MVSRKQSDLFSNLIRTDLPLGGLIGACLSVAGAIAWHYWSPSELRLTPPSDTPEDQGVYHGAYTPLSGFEMSHTFTWGRAVEWWPATYYIVVAAFAASFAAALIGSRIRFSSSAFIGAWTGFGATIGLAFAMLNYHFPPRQQLDDPELRMRLSTSQTLWLYPLVAGTICLIAAGGTVLVHAWRERAAG